MTALVTAGVLTQPAGSAGVDGRLARSARTRTAVIDALLALYEEGDLSPTAVRVAARAGVALRTVYGHFADMESLYAEASEREFGRMAEVGTVVPADLPYDERVRRFAENRAVVLEWMLPVMRAAAMREHGSRQLQRSRDRFVAVGDAEVRLLLADELVGLDARQRADLLQAVHVVAGGPAWIALRIDRGLPPEAAGQLLHRLVSAMLADLLEP